MHLAHSAKPTTHGLHGGMPIEHGRQLDKYPTGMAQQFLLELADIGHAIADSIGLAPLGITAGRI